MKVVGYYPQRSIGAKDIQLAKTNFVKHGFVYMGTARTFQELQQLLDQGGITVVAGKMFNEMGSKDDRLELVLLLLSKGATYFDTEYDDMQTIVGQRPSSSGIYR